MPGAAVVRRWEVALPLALAAAAQAELHLPHSADPGPLEPGNAVVALLATAPLALARRAPVAPVVAAGAWAAEPLLLPVSNTFALALSAVVLAPLLAVLVARSPGRAALAAGSVVALVVAQGFLDGRFGLGGAVSNGVFAGSAATLGAVLRRHRTSRARAEERARDERRARERADAALAEERARMARELHDVVGHALSVVVLQARGARRVLPTDPATAAQALDEVERAAGRALAEMRLLVGVLRPGGGDGSAPHPGPGELRALVASVRATGARVSADLPDPASLPAGALGVTVHRIAQEGLTNALRHAPGHAVHLSVRAQPDVVVVEVLDAPPGGPAGTGPTPLVPGVPGGAGLLGVRERVELFGGELAAGPTSEGGWRLRAALPTGAPSVLPGVDGAVAR
ncbi:sensor histidine kinase [Streptomyces sp. NP160]|uniref:sensor histidine kinase n=1 Tax=Streptomyces sp. NP160 TaxID=2586637 RepID=UPI0015D61CA1|nr:histidine kinase [Streptomyces sp. NP160]